ncbi:MAG: GntR family transcriptional regulator, partial [Ornithinimicrobium sp.]
MNAVTVPRLVPVRAGNVFEETMEALLQEIRLGQLAPGEKLLPERELAEALGVSRTTLREVLGHLSKTGYVTVRRGRYGGTYVAEPVPPAPGSAGTTPDWAQVSDVLTLRRVVEPAAAEMAAERGVTQPEAEQLWLAHQECCVAQADRYRPLDSRLHLLIADLSGSPRLRQVV